MQIVPTIFEKDYKEVENKLDSIREQIRTVHVDVIDEVFLEGRTFNLEDLAYYPFASEFVWEVHLMVKEPIKWLAKCQAIGALRVWGQVEMMSSPASFLEAAHEVGFEVGLAFDVESEIEVGKLDLDGVLLMARKAGFGEDKFREDTYDKVYKLKKLQEDMGVPFGIGVDGGIEDSILHRLAEAGVDSAYMGKHAFWNENPVENYKRLCGLM